MKKSMTVVLFVLLIAILSFSVAAEMMIKAPYVKKGPKIDGKLDDEAWQIAAEKGGKGEIAFLLNALPIKNDKSEVYVCWDDEYLYVAFKNYQKESTVVVTAAADGVDIWNTDDDNEIFLSTTFPGTRPFLQAIISPAGFKTSSGFGTVYDWDAAASITKDYWVTEIAIPFDMMNLWPEVNEEWAINLTRRYANAVGTDDEWRTWSNLPVTTFLDPNVFGILLFVK